MRTRPGHVWFELSFAALVCLVSLAARAHADDAPIRIAGVLPCSAAIERRWPASGAWMYPVGGRRDVERALATEPAFHVSRGLEPRTKHGRGHLGVDLLDGHAGDPVRAAAGGVVACVDREPSGYGDYVVLAHRLEDGTLAYSVYAHLQHEAVALAAGATVPAGATIGRVGRTGNATTPHLHFEVRVPEDSTDRWEHCPIVDPIAFVAERLPSARADTAWSTPYLEWAEPELLARMRDALDRAFPEGTVVIGPPDPAGDAPAPDAARTREPMTATWSSVAVLAARTGAGDAAAIDPARHRAACVARLGDAHPTSHLAALGERFGMPRLDDVCLALADAAIGREERAAR
jgi:murein DD-endopeptidase MepM/ murein hydrolase activator NlpD